jgi:hypothetical protein
MMNSNFIKSLARPTRGCQSRKKPKDHDLGEESIKDASPKFKEQSSKSKEQSSTSKQQMGPLCTRLGNCPDLLSCTWLKNHPAHIPTGCEATCLYILGLAQ